jgi:hypothetical protein
LTGEPPEPAFLIAKPFSNKPQAVIGQALFLNDAPDAANKRAAVGMNLDLIANINFFALAFPAGICSGLRR